MHVECNYIDQIQQIETEHFNRVNDSLTTFSLVIDKPISVIFPTFILTTCSKLAHFTLHGRFVDRVQELPYTEKLMAMCRNELTHTFRHEDILHMFLLQEQPPLDESSTSTTLIPQCIESPIIKQCKRPQSDQICNSLSYFNEQYFEEN